MVRCFDVHHVEWGGGFQVVGGVPVVQLQTEHGRASGATSPWHRKAVAVDDAWPVGVFSAFSQIV